MDAVGHIERERVQAPPHMQQRACPPPPQPSQTGTPNLLDNGRFGVVRKYLGAEQARAWGRQQERWRFAVADAVQARAATCDAAPKLSSDDARKF